MFVLHGVAECHVRDRALRQMIKVAARGEQQLVGDHAGGALAEWGAGAVQGEQMTVIDVGVVGQHVDGQGLVFRAGGDIGHRDWAVVGTSDGHVHRTRRKRAVFVLHGVAECHVRDRALRQMIKVAARGEHQLVGDHAGGALAEWGTGAVQGEQMTVVDVGVVGQHVDGQGLVFRAGGDIGYRDRTVIGAGDGDRHQVGGDATEAIADLHGEHLSMTLANLQ